MAEHFRQFLPVKSIVRFFIIFIFLGGVVQMIPTCFVLLHIVMVENEVKFDLFL